MNNEFIDCIKNSELYESFEDKICGIPKRYSPEWIYSIEKLRINNSQELRHVIDVLRFWMVNKLPHALYEYVYNITQSFKSTLNDDYEEITKVLNDDNFHDFKLVNELKVIAQEKEHNRPIKTASEARINKSSNLLDFLKNKGYYFNSVIASYYSHFLPKSERFKKIVELYENNQIPKEKISIICISKHSDVNLQLLAYFSDEIKKYQSKYLTVFGRAVNHNDFESFKYLCTNNLFTYESMKKYFGGFAFGRFNKKKVDLKYFKFLNQNNLLDQHILNIANEYFGLDIVKYLYENGYRLDTSKYARIIFKNLENLKYMSSVGFFITNKNISQFLHFRKFDCLKFSLENRAMTQHEALSIIKFACSYFDAVTNDKVFEERKECLEYLINKYNVDITQEYQLIEKLALTGYKKMIKWFLDLGCPVNQKAFQFCLQKNYINILKRLCKNDPSLISNINHTYLEDNIFNKIVTIKCSNQKTYYRYLTKYCYRGLHCKHAKHDNLYKCNIIKKPHFYKLSCCCDKCAKTKYEKSFECIKYVHKNYKYVKIIQNKVIEFKKYCKKLLIAAVKKQFEVQEELSATIEQLKIIRDNVRNIDIRRTITSGINNLNNLNNQHSKNADILQQIVNKLDEINFTNHHVIPENLYSSLISVKYTCNDLSVPFLSYVTVIKNHIQQISSDLKYVEINTWNKETINLAAEYGNLKCLKYLHKHKCPYNGQEACRRAGEYSQVKCLIYMLKHKFMEIPLKKRVKMNKSQN